MKEQDNQRARCDDNLSRLYHDAVRPDPAAALDAVILAAARGAAAARPQGKLARSRSQRWRLPFALAATVVLSVAVTTTVRDVLPPGTVAIPRPAAAPEAASADSAAKAGANFVDRSAPRMPAAAALAQPAYEPAPSRQESAPIPPQVPLSAPQPMRERMEQAAAPAPLAAPAAQGAFATGAALPLRSNSEDKAVSVMAAPRMPEKSALSSGLRDDKADAAVTEQKSADAWIDEIRELKRAGRVTEAAARLSEFNKRFPDYKLPADLK